MRSAIVVVQVKDAAYFDTAIAPILRKMPQQKLAVLQGLQVGVHQHVVSLQMCVCNVLEPVCWWPPQKHV